MTREVVLERACSCAASASGPRIVTSSRFDDVALAIVVRAIWVQLACDACDTPWRIRT